MSRLKNNEILKSIYLHIDSRDRDLNKYPNSNSYRIKLLNNKIRNVKSIELISAKIPKTGYIVNEYNNKMNFQENSVNYEVTLSLGNYSSVSFSSEIENKLNNLGTTNSYSVSIDNSTSLLSISRNSGSNSFALLFSSGSFSDSINSNGNIIRGLSARTLMGFEIQDYSDSSGTITSPKKIDLNSNDEIFLEINNYMGNINALYSENSNLRGKIFSHIYLDVLNDQIKYIKYPDNKIIKDFFPPMNNLGFLEINFKDYFGKLYNFRGAENSIVLRVSYLEKGFI